MKIFDVEHLKTLETKETIDNYLIEVGYTEYNQKIEAVNLASRSGEVDYGLGEEKLSDKTKYNTVVTMILDNEFRYLRGLPPIFESEEEFCVGYCPECGEPLDDDENRICNDCTKYNSWGDEYQIICKECNTAYTSDFKSCPGCENGY